MCPPIRREWGAKWALSLLKVCMYAVSFVVVRRRLGKMHPVSKCASARAASVASGHKADQCLGRSCSVQ